MPSNENFSQKSREVIDVNDKSNNATSVKTGQLTEREKLDFKREGIRLIFGYSVVTIGFIAATIILFMPSMEKFHNVALTMLGAVFTAATALVFNNNRKND